jgi:FKBP-type peptidyl-prolyl cis-trans isomerase SlyD
MKIGSNAVVSIDYTLRSDKGQVLDSSDGGEPLTYLHGQGQIIPGLEAALAGKSKGDALKVVVPPKDGYGERTPDSTVRVRREELPEGQEPEVGMELEAEGPDGESQQLWIVAVEKDSVVLSSDHPLAGETLHFDVTVRDVRAATEEELAHGHAHGEHGHDHDHDH